MESPKCFTWTEDKTALFITCIEREKALHKTGADNNGISKPAWMRIVAEFNCLSNENATKAQLQSKLSILKKKWDTFSALKRQSGWAWDNVENIPSVSVDVWNDYVASHPDAKEFRFKSLKYYNELDGIFTGKIATGKYAR